MMQPSILLGSGGYFDFVNPNPEVLTIEDYAAGLAFQSRFAGQCWVAGRRVYYSVAQHCVIGSYQFGDYRRAAFEFLMHEAGESVTHDMTSPLKALCPDFKTVEKRCETAIKQRFNVSNRHPGWVKQVDLRMWVTERAQLMNWDGKPWSGDGFGDDVAGPLKVFDINIEPVGPYEAYELFLTRYRELAP